MVDGCGRHDPRDRRVAHGETNRHHRCHRVRRHRPRRAAHPGRARLRAGARDPSRPAHDRRTSARRKRSSTTTPSTACAPSSATRSTTRSPVASPPSPVTSAPTGSASTTTDRAAFASCDIVIHSAAAVSFDSPLDSAVEINLLGPTRVAQLCHDARHHAAPRLGVDVLRRRQPSRQRARATRERGPVRHRPVVEGGGRRGTASQGRHRGASRQPAQLAEFRRDARREIGAAGAPALAVEDRAAPDALGEGSARRGRAGTGGVGRMAGRLRVHEGARRAGADRVEG